VADQIVTVVIIRHPDNETQYSAYAPAGIEVEFIEADLGSSFDGEPTDQEEAEIAIEIANRLETGVANLPEHSDTRALAESWAESLRNSAAEYIDEEEDPS
jgi:hypothetical protein